MPHHYKTLHPSDEAESRALLESLDWDFSDDARALRALQKIADKPAADGPSPEEPGTIRAALEAAGVKCVAANGGGAGVRLRKTAD